MHFFMASKNVLLVIVTSWHHFRSDLYLLELIGTSIYDWACYIIPTLTGFGTVTMWKESEE